MYGFVTVWASMDDGPSWVILLMYGSHDIRHTGFPQVDGLSTGPLEIGASHTYCVASLSFIVTGLYRQTFI